MSKPLCLCVSAAAVLLAGSTLVSAQTYTVIRALGTHSGDPHGPVDSEVPAQSRGGALFLTAPWDHETFRMWPGGELQVLHVFAGGVPAGGLTLAVDGMYYGTTQNDGLFGEGTIFKMTQDGVVTKLHDFTGGADGAYAYAPPIQSVEGDFFGTTGGTVVASGPGYGSVYRITKYGNFTILHTFVGSDGSRAESPLVQGTDFNFYGTAATGGLNDCGTIFRVSALGEFGVLHKFNQTDGCEPIRLLQATDGNFYGVTYTGGTFNGGVLFRMTTDGAVTVLHNFTGGSDGTYPTGGLLQASDGNLYGATGSGTNYLDGAIYRATLSGTVVQMHHFTVATGFQPEGLMQHTNGKLYGLTELGGKGSEGVFYSLDPGLPAFVRYLPTYGRAGALVQILGQGFTADTQVWFNGTRASAPDVVYPTYLRVTVPAGATSGLITVSTASGTLSSDKVFVVH